MNSIRKILPLVVVALLASALPASATVVRFLSMEEHVASSDAIVRVRVGGETTFVSEKDGRPRTDRRVRVLESYKGPFAKGEVFAVRQMRGTTAEGELHVAGDPALREGDELILFLVLGTEEGSERIAYLTSLAQSKYTITRDLSGAWAKRTFEGLAFTFGDDGRAVMPADEPAIRLELLEESIRSFVH